MVQIGNLKLSVWNLIRKLNVLRHTTLHMHASEKKWNDRKVEKGKIMLELLFVTILFIYSI